MPIRFHCESCDARIKVPGGSEGRKVSCPRCGQMQRVPRHAEQHAGAGVGAGGDAPTASADSGLFEAASPDDSAMDLDAAQPPAASEPIARKGGTGLGDSLADLAAALPSDKDMTPPHVAARAITEPSTPPTPPAQPTAQQQPPSQPTAPPRPAPAPPRAVPLSAWAARRPASSPTPAAAPPIVPVARPPREPAAEPTPYLALRNLATALRITPALLIPGVLWHILSTTTASGAIVTLIGGGAIVAMTWTLAEIADAVRDMAMQRTAAA